MNWIRSKRIELLETSETRLSVTTSESSKPSGLKIIDVNDEAQQSSKDKEKGKGKTRSKVASGQSLSPNGYTYKLTNLKVAESPNTPDWRALCHNRVMDMEGTSVLLKEFDKNALAPCRYVIIPLRLLLWILNLSEHTSTNLCRGKTDG